MKLPASKMIIASNGIDLSKLDHALHSLDREGLRAKLGLTSDDFVFLNVASIYPPKAQKFIVQALAQVLPTHPNAKVVFLGKVMDHQYMGMVRKEIDQNGINDAVIFVGYHDDVFPFYILADAFILPSFWEGWSLALTEAVGTSLPIIASDIGGAREILQKTGGQLVAPPFHCITELDASNAVEFIRQDHPKFVHELAKAMQHVCINPVPSKLPAPLRQSLDRHHAYTLHAQLFRWLIQRGDPSSARQWLKATSDHKVHRHSA
jgi:glycosyltransferase involved in cell wall biosynthesis